MPHAQTTPHPSSQRGTENKSVREQRTGASLRAWRTTGGGLKEGFKRQRNERQSEKGKELSIPDATAVNSERQTFKIE